MRDARSSLFQEVPRIEALVKQVFRWCPTYRLIENVASMDKRDCASMNAAYHVEPWVVDAGGISLARRPRLYWRDWDIMPQEGCTIDEGRVRDLPVRGSLRLTAQVSDEDFLEGGWERANRDSPFPTFTTARPSVKPGRKPAGLPLCPPDAVACWQSDAHRFPPYQYRAENCVTNRKGDLRVPSTREREVILGFPLEYTRRCMVKGKEGSIEHNDCRLRLLGNSWSVPVVCVCVALFLVSLAGLDATSDHTGHCEPSSAR